MSIFKYSSQFIAALPTGWEIARANQLFQWADSGDFKAILERKTALAAPSKMAVNFCPRCGAKQEQAVAFCGNCGNKLR